MLLLLSSLRDLPRGFRSLIGWPCFVDLHFFGLLKTKLGDGGLFYRD